MITPVQILLEMGLRAHAVGDLDAAKRCYESVLLIDPTSVSANGWLGTIEAQRRNFPRAQLLLERALADSNDPDFLLNYANLLQENCEYDRALIVYEKAVRERRNGVSLSSLATCYHKLCQLEKSLRCVDESLAIEPGHAEAWSNRGNVLRDLRRHEEALASYEQAIELKPNYAKAWSNRGNALSDLRCYKEALASYERAIELKPDYAEAWFNRGDVLNDLHRDEEALASYERAIELKPDADYVLGGLVHTQMKICDWTDFDERCRTLQTGLLRGDRASSPFAVLGLFDDPHLQRRCAELHAKRKFSLQSELVPISRRSRKDKIRVGYFSMDFREHPVAHLMTELIENHDRERFEILGFSFGEASGDSMRKRLEDAFDKFLEVRHLSDFDIARLAREHEIDIAIDLGGYTQDSRPAIFAHRAAPIQINYLGFPGTMGTEHYDYFIGDRVTISDENLAHFVEKIIFMPDSFQSNPTRRLIGSRVPSRASYGLPESGFVFCCFNNVWKITPTVFRIWADILREVDNSVLWLSADLSVARLRLRGALESLGIDGNRLVFSPRVTREIYLDQYRFADVFLDTLPYNAGTTASDALWMGTPIVTLAGKSFAGRMAASLLDAVGLPELITHTAQEYESLAIELAKDPEKIASLKASLAKNRSECPLFNTSLFTRHIESAYLAAYDRQHNGLAPDHIYVGM